MKALPVIDMPRESMNTDGAVDGVPARVV